jgi:hypothetical protein
MGRQLVGNCIVELNGQELETARGLTVSKTDPKTPVKTMRSKRAALGYTRGVPDFTATLEVAQLFGTPEVDWDELQKSAEEFLIVYEKGVDGQRRHLIDCVVDDISEPYTAEGESRISITIKALDEKPE